MPVTLEVEFSGLCLYAVPPTGAGPVTVLLPDCRLNGDSVYVPHPEPGGYYGQAEPHAGYLRWSPNPPAPATSASGIAAPPPAARAVHRLVPCEVSIVSESGETSGGTRPTMDTFAVPSFADIAPDAGGTGGLTLAPGVLGGTPPSQLLMRMELGGGTLRALPDESWVIPGALRPNADDLPGEFADYVRWTRTFSANGLSLHIEPFDGSPATQAALHPDEDGVVRVTVGNLCCTNPMDWAELPQNVDETVDHDFALLYKLVKPKGTGSLDKLPVPTRPGGRGALGVEGCLPATIPTS